MADLRIAPAPVSTRLLLVPSLMALGAGLVWSLGALTTRLADSTDAWQYLVWRSVAILVAVEVINLFRGRGSTMSLAFKSGWLMIAASVALLLASVAYIYALKNTTAANTAFLASMTPLMAAILARSWLKEHLSRVTIGAAGAAMVGVLIMVVADIGAGRMSGNVAAVGSSIGFAVYTVCIRSDPGRDWTPVLPGYASMMVVVGSMVTMAGGRPLIPPIADIGYASIHGAVFVVIGTMLFNHASRTIPSAAITVFAQTETVAVPLWIFLAFGEKPGPATVLGGVIILAAVVTKALLDTRPGEPATHREAPGTAALP